ncbi:DNA-directed RNA polymerase RPB5 subunit, eukaryote/virus [Trema orientale]|uniref:DNA-directed RNA polymerase RPB5 subunit, eukaryote/virus n=1 Tax=Trema orientale TaxID=63057 RepID=A0A2P5ECD7_TREOI|nr:DNA-directed RNA polymerase RPB5 subunit, eukaryote/virus [Trema orientale]
MEANGSGGGGEMNEEPLGLCLSGYVDQGSVESHRYYLSRRTVMEMLKDRGFSVPTSDVNLTLNDFRAINGQTPEPDRLRFSVTHLKDPSKRILVIFCGPGVVKVNSVRSIAAQIVNKDTLTGLILILESQMTNQAQKSLDLLPFKVEIFQITDLLVNITKHVLKPKYEFLTNQQKQRLLKKYSIEEKQLPRMLKQDAIARYYALQKGQVVKISYSGGISENYVTYRCVW